MIEILMVCTGNICRSPLAELVLKERLAGLDAWVRSAGTRALPDAPMTDEAQRLAVERGVDAGAAAAHRSRPLTERRLTNADVILVMTREHRSAVAELAPARLRSTFTVREFARLAQTVTDAEIAAAADAAGDEPGARLRAASALVAERRGLAAPLADPADDDVIDPYRRSWKTYMRSAAQLDPALVEVGRVAHLALERNTAVAD